MGSARSTLVLGLVGLFGVLVAPGCSSVDDDSTSADELGGSDTWVLPATVSAAGAKIRISYEDSPAWNGGRSCTGSLREGARELGTRLRARFDAVASVGGYACRTNTADSSRVSVHGTGRALDVMIPPDGDSANTSAGDPLANWLVVNAENIGVDLIIWNHTIWRSNGTNEAPYSGPVPHIDHIHVELTEAAARMTTPFFTRGVSIDVAGARVPGGASDAGRRSDATAPRADASLSGVDDDGGVDDTPIYVGGSDPPPSGSGSGGDDSPYGPGDIPGSGDGTGTGAPNNGTGWPTSPSTTPSIDAGAARPTPAAAAPVAPPPVTLNDGTVGAADSLGTGTRATPPPKAHGATHPPIETCSAAPVGAHGNAPPSAMALALAALAAWFSRARRRDADRARD